MDRLYDNNQLFKQIFEHSSLCMAILTPSGHFLHMNDTYCSFTGYGREELIDLGYQAICLEEDRSSLMDKFNLTFERNIPSFNIEKRYVHKKGHIVWGLTNVSIVRNEDESLKYIITQVQDITDKKEAEQALVHNEEKYRLLAECSTDFIAKKTVKGVFTYCSPACLTLLGYNPEELIGTSCDKLIHPEDYHRVMDKISKTVFQEPVVFTYRAVRKDGSFVWVETTLSVIRKPGTNEAVEILSAFRDITERVRMEQKLKESEERYRKIAEESPHATFISINGVYTYVNNTGVQLIGAKDKSQIIGKTTFHFTPRKYHDELLERRKIIHRGERPGVSEIKLLRLDGKDLDVEVKSIPIEIDGQTASHTIVIDVTELKKHRELLHQSEKLVMVGELAAGVAHEVRNPLTSLRGFIQLFKTKLGLPDDNLYINIMLQEVDRINSVISELLLLGKTQVEEFIPENPAVILEEVITFMTPEGTLNNIQIQKDIALTGIQVLCSPGKLKQVFINVLKNAMESMPDGGTIRVTAALEGCSVVLRFIDEGCGIPDEVIPKIGKAFFTTKEKGTGLGCAISFSIINGHGGTMKILSEEHKGTTVEIELPTYS